MTRYKPIENEIFHVHTFRCKHAGDTKDCEYVEKAIELGAPRIVFTDHAPFPGNPFGHRMDIEELPEYAASINALKEQYKDKIEVLCGLEIEYLPSFTDYYKELREMDGLDVMLLGQHFYEHEPGVYSFRDEVKTDYYMGLCDAVAKGIETGLFDVVAHPDRAFRVRKKWRDKEIQAATKIYDAVMKYDPSIYLEKNYSSMRHKGYYWPEFWDMFSDYENILYGYDAHCLDDMCYNE